MRTLTTIKNFSFTEQIFNDLNFPIHPTNEPQIKVDGIIYDFRSSHYGLKQAIESKNQSRLKDDIIIVKRKLNDYAAYLKG